MGTKGLLIVRSTSIYVTVFWPENAFKSPSFVAETLSSQEMPFAPLTGLSEWGHSAANPEGCGPVAGGGVS